MSKNPFLASVASLVSNVSDADSSTLAGDASASTVALIPKVRLTPVSRLPRALTPGPRVLSPVTRLIKPPAVKPQRRTGRRRSHSSPLPWASLGLSLRSRRALSPRRRNQTARKQHRPMRRLGRRVAVHRLKPRRIRRRPRRLYVHPVPCSLTGDDRPCSEDITVGLLLIATSNFGPSRRLLSLEFVTNPTYDSNQHAQNS